MNDQNQQPESDSQERSHFTTRLQTIERQVGENVLAALEADSTVAVLTTVVSGIRADRVVSVPLSSDQVQDISAILAQAQVDPDEPDQDGGTIGFHVVLENDQEPIDEESTDDESKS